MFFELVSPFFRDEIRATTFAWLHASLTNYKSGNLIIFLMDYSLLKAFFVLAAATVLMGIPCLADSGDAASLAPNPESSRDWMIMGDWIFNETLPNGLNYEYADSAFSVALILDPANTDAWFKKGNALSGLGRYEKAIQAYDLALEQDPGFVDAIEARKKARQKLGNADQSTDIVSFNDTGSDSNEKTAGGGGVN